MKNIDHLYKTTNKLASSTSKSTDVEFDLNRLDPLDVNNSIVNIQRSQLVTCSSNSSNSFDFQSVHQNVHQNVHLNSNPLSDKPNALKIDSKLNSHPHNEQFKNEADRTQLSYSSFKSPLSSIASSNHSMTSSFYSRLVTLVFIILFLNIYKSSAAVVSTSFANNQDANFLNAFNESILSNSIEAIDQTYKPANQLQTVTPPSSKQRRYLNDKDQLNLQIAGFRLEGERVEIGKDQITSVFSDHEYSILLYGFNFTNYTNDLLLSITSTSLKRGEDCSIYSKDVYNLSVITNQLARSVIQFDAGDATKAEFYYLCIDYKSQSIHQGDELWMRIHVKNKLLPVWLQIFFIFILLCLAGLFSGLNLGLMALDPHELEVIESCGTPTEKKYARRIKPVRKRGNYLLCTILLGNVMVQTSLTVLLEDLTSGLIAVIGSTFSIVVFGEIVPQAICSRQGLAIGANTVFLMWFFMLVTFPISFPVSWALDKVLGKEIGKIYDRDRLTEYLRITQRYNKLDTDELNIIQGALKLKKITVSEVMTKLEDIFSLPAKSVLNFNTLTLIQKSGFSRIPVYDTDRSNIVAVLFAKDLAFVDPDDKVPIQTLCQYYKHEISYIFADANCHTAFTLFKEGKSHMAFVVRVSEELDEKDPHYEVLGLVTLEDVLEEVLQTEIVDETDVLTDNRKKKRRKEVQSRIDYAEFCLLNNEEQGQHVVSPTMVLVSYQYLSTSVPAFSKRFITENVLRKLINQNIYHKEDPISCYSDTKIFNLYEQNKEYDYFVLILEGYVLVNLGKENLSFQSGPFTIFGSSTLKLKDEDNLTLESLDSQLNEPFSWTSDYTVEVVEKTTYLKLNRKLYISAVRQSIEEILNVLPHENKDTNSTITKNDTNAFNGLKLKFNNDKKF